MSTSKPIQIIGGGLAGLALGIGLRQQGISVAIHEAGNYPRHRVCGEFISGRGQESLARLGLQGLIECAGAIPAHTAAFFTAEKSMSPRRLPASAICLSRHVLDQLLANDFQKLGGELFVGARWNPVEVSDAAAIDPLKRERQLEGIVRATGRRLQVEPGSERWFGLKIHARKISLTADLEMHVSPQGYVGLCKLAGGEVNVCGLFRRRVDGKAALPNPRELLRGLPGSLLRQRLAAAELDENSFCAIAGLSLQPQPAAARQEICVGDSLTMIPPVTGNGMSMALESAELAVKPLAAWSRGELSWIETRQTIARACDDTFSRRLAWAKWLQRLVLTPVLQNPLITLASRSDWFWRLAFEKTR